MKQISLFLFRNFIKGRQSPKFAKQNLLQESERTKKPHQKILNFDEVMACQSSPFFGPLKNELKFSRGI